MLAGRRYHPIWTMVASVVLVAIAAVMLLAGFPLVALAIALYGAGNGRRFGGPRHCPDGPIRPGAVSGFDGTIGSSTHDRNGDFPFHRGVSIPARRGFLDARAAGCTRANQRLAYRRALGTAAGGPAQRILPRRKLDRHPISVRFRSGCCDVDPVAPAARPAPAPSSARAAIR